MPQGKGALYQLATKGVEDNNLYTFSHFPKIIFFHMSIFSFIPSTYVEGLLFFWPWPCPSSLLDFPFSDPAGEFVVVFVYGCSLFWVSLWSWAIFWKPILTTQRYFGPPGLHFSYTTIYSKNLIKMMQKICSILTITHHPSKRF